MLKKKRKFFYVFLLPSFAGIMLFVILPFADVVKRSFTTAVTGQFNGIKNYQTIFHNQAFLLAVGNTLKFTLVCIPFLVLTGFVTALLLNQLESKGFVKSVYLFPLAARMETTARLAYLFLTRLLGWTGFWGEVHTDYLGSGAAFWVLVGSYIWKNLGYTVILWLAGLMGIPTEFYEAAKVDGANSLQRLWYITLPNLKGSLYTIVVLSFLNSFKIYREAYLTSGAYPDKSIYLLQHVFNNWFVNLELDKMAAAAVCTGGVLMIVILILQRLWDRNEA